MFEKYKKIKPSLDPNYCSLPINYLYVADIQEFNEIYKSIYGWRKLKRSPSGGIVKKGFMYPCYDVDISNSSIGLIICSKEGFFRVQFQFSNYTVDEDNKKINGTKAFREFEKICKQFNIDLKKYKIKNGYEIKKEIEKPLICMEHNHYIGLTLKNVHHLDINSAWPAGLVRMHHEFAPVIDYIFCKKQELKEKGVDTEHNIYKAILNLAIGYMQSMKAIHRASWAHLSRDAINNNNEYMRTLAKELKEGGRSIIAYNTDGIWYMGNVYHGKGEGVNLGQWENDHTNCTIRFKSAGAYEYLENGIYKPVVRGRTRLDLQLPREKWQWGDIFKEEAKEIIYTFVEGIGIIEGEEYELQRTL